MAYEVTVVPNEFPFQNIETGLVLAQQLSFVWWYYTSTKYEKLSVKDRALCELDPHHVQ